MRSHAKAASAGTTRRQAALFVAMAVGLSMLALSSPASATFGLSGSFSGFGSGDGQLDVPGRAAVDEDTGNLFVADGGNDRIQVFEPDGFSSTYIDQFTDASIDAPLGIAIDQTNGSIYVSDANDVVKFTSAFVLDGSFTSPGITGPIAVDPTDGDLLVADQATNTIKRFNSNGNPDGAPAINGSTSPGGAFTGLLDIAVNSSGDIYVVDANGPIKSGPDGTPFPSGTSRVERYGSNGAYKATLTPVGPNQRPATVTVDQGNDNVTVSGEQDAIYRDQSATIHVFDSANLPVRNFVLSSPPPYIPVAGLAVDTGLDRLYVIHDFGYYSDGIAYGSQPGIQIYSVLPTVTTNPASTITPTAASLNATVDPEGVPITDCHFDWGLSNSYGKTAPCVPAPGGGFGAVAVAAALSGLTSGTTYHFRIVATNANGVSRGVNRAFVTPEAVKNLSTKPATGITATTATLNGSLDPDGVAITDCHLSYATEADFQATGFFNATNAACVPDPGSGSGDVAVSAPLSGLEPGTTYRFRLQASNTTGTTIGATLTFTTPPAVKNLSTKPATAITATAATLNGSLDPDGVVITDCHLSYVTEADFQANGFANATDAACVPDPGSGSGDVAVSAAVSGLEPGTTYRFRLQASNASGTTIGTALSFITVGPRISGTVATQIGTGGATLNAQVNPQGQPTTYHFEYGTSTSYGQETPESATVGSDSLNHLASEVIEGLTPNTTYHFRAVATSADGVSHGPDVAFTTYTLDPVFETCSNEVFRTGPSAKLPDCRAYEQASPLGKNGVDATGRFKEMQASLAGDAVTFTAQTGVPGGVGAQVFPTYLAKRSATGWSTQGLLPSPSYGERMELRGSSADLAYFFAISAVASNGGYPLDSGLLSRSSADGSVQEIVPPAELGEGVYTFVDTSADNSKVLFEANSKIAKLTPDTVLGKSNLYVWDRASGDLALAGILPDSACPTLPCTPPGGSFAGSFDWFLASNPGKSSALEYYVQDQHVISNGGDKVFFTAGDTGQLYLRTDPAEPGAETVHVSASQRSVPDPNGTMPAIFMEATPSGSVAFFVSCEKLTDDSTAVSTAADTSCNTARPTFTPPAPQGSDLYVYDTASGELTDLTVDSGANPKGADVKGVLGASDDGSYVYFVANGDLDGKTGPATLGNCRGAGGGGLSLDYVGVCNLYLSHDGDLTFIDQLDANGNFSDAVNWEPAPKALDKTTRVSADGKTLLFRSQRQLTSYDNSNPVACGPSGRCPELYLYRVGEPGFTCVSCNPTGAAPSGIPRFRSLHGIISPSEHSITLSRNLSADGNRVFFETPDKLLAADTNGDSSCPPYGFAPAVFPACQDVYEWEAEGTGSCDTPGGCLYLLSTGTSPTPSFFADASVSGDDAFVFTRDSLVPGDTDELTDVYDVRAGGGLASQHAVVPPPCEGISCRGASTSAPPPSGAGTAVFQGSGDPKAKRRPDRKRRHPRVHKKKKRNGKHKSRNANKTRRQSR